MNIIDRYIARSILLSTTLVLLVLVALDRLFAFIRQLDDIGKGTYDLGGLATNVALHIPGSMYEMISTAALLGTLLGLGTLANNSELIVVRSVGMSIPRIARPLFIVGALLATATFSMGEWVVPQTEEFSSRQRLKAISPHVSVEVGSGLWLREGNRFINVRRVLSGLNLRDIRVYEYNEEKLVATLRAKSASFDKKTGWQLSNVELSQIENGEMASEFHQTLHQEILLNPQMLRTLSLEPNILSTQELYENVRYLQANQLRSNAYELAFWSRFSVPASAVVMLLIALPFAFGTRRTSSVGQRIFIGSLIGIGYLLLSKVSNQLGLIVGIHGAIGAFFPIILFAALALTGVSRVARF